jgi:flavin reductase (DIM6/NTAB) family NADH-FMN oxidoreductase RutF
MPETCYLASMPKRKSLTPAEQAEKFRLAAKKRTDAGMPSIADADAAMDAKIAKNIKDYGA